MVKLHLLPKIGTKSAKRVGRGWGSGKGKYSGRGNKGQKSREKVKWFFEGGQSKLQKRLPMIRGKGKNRSIQTDSEILNVGALELLPSIKTGDTITQEYLQKLGIIEKGQEVKILGKGKLTKKLTVEVLASALAIEKVKLAGGKYQP